MKKLLDYLRGRRSRGFRPTPHYNPHDDSLTVFVRGNPAYAVQVSSTLTEYRCMETGVVVGVKIAGVSGMIQERRT